MQRKVVVEGEATEDNVWGVRAVAKAFHLRAKQTVYQEATRRNLSEGYLLCHVLDHLAAERYDQAADAIAQRYTAPEAVSVGIPWDRLKFLELVYEEDNSLVGQHERALLAHGMAKAAKVAVPTWPSLSWKASFREERVPSRWQKGKGKDKSKDKGDSFADRSSDSATPAWEGGWQKKYEDGKKWKGKGKDKGKE